MLRRISSRELSEWMAYFQWKASPTSQPVPVESAEERSVKLKAALFKGK
jgi:hypothetical protein